MRTTGTPTSTIARVQTMPSIGAATSPPTIGALTTDRHADDAHDRRFRDRLAGRDVDALHRFQRARARTDGSSGGGGTPTVAGSARGGMVFDEPCEPEEVLCIEVR